MTAKTFQTWLSERTDNAGARELAAKVGLTHTTISRQLTGRSALDAGLVIKLARAYDLDVLTALVAAGFITPAEAHSPALEIALREASDSDLAREILRRAEHSERMGWNVSRLAETGDDVIRDLQPTELRAAETGTDSLYDDQNPDAQNDDHGA